ncbi:MAG TPA: transporter substrate-binding domain-containing protein, partial [Clostridia bacterium]|nr:transporter substrate-binding domain-containing protein [Clostridia bacterium]
FASVLALGIVSAVVAGCGGSGASAPASSTPPASSGAPSAAEVKKVNVALESGSKPLSFEDEKGNKVGYEVDVLAAVDALIPDYDFNLEFVESDATSIGLDTGKYVLIGGGLYKTKERQEKYLLPDALNGVSLINIYVHEDDNSIKSLDDLVGKKVVPSTPNGGIYNLMTSYNAEHPNAPITITTAEGVSVADRFASVDTKQYDALVLPNNLGFNEIKAQLNLKVKAVETPVKINGTYFALAKDQTDLAAKVNDALKTLREDGMLAKLSVKWYGVDTIQYYKD